MNKTIKFKGSEHLPDINVSKVTQIKLRDKEFIYFDKLEDGTWRLCYTVKEFSK